MKYFVLALALLVVFPQDAHAYLDPGTGSMMLQGLLAGILAVSLTVKTYWLQIKLFFSRDTGTKAVEDQSAKSTDS